jgi:hypothetical protein
MKMRAVSLGGVILAIGVFVAGPALSQEARVVQAGAFEPAPSLLVLVPQDQLEIQRFGNPAGALISLAGAGIGDALHARRVRNQEPATGVLRTALEAIDLPTFIAEAVREHLVGMAGISTESLEVRIGSLEGEVLEQALAPMPDVLKLTLEYYLTWDFSRFRVRVSAELYREAGRRAGRVFLQRTWFEVPAPRMSVGGRDDKYMAYWTSREPDALRGMLREGIDRSFAMLAADIPQSVRLGMQRGAKSHHAAFPPGTPVAVAAAPDPPARSR